MAYASNQRRFVVLFCCQMVSEITFILTRLQAGSTPWVTICTQQPIQWTTASWVDVHNINNKFVSKQSSISKMLQIVDCKANGKPKEDENHPEVHIFGRCRGRAVAFTSASVKMLLFIVTNLYFNQMEMFEMFSVNCPCLSTIHGYKVIQTLSSIILLASQGKGVVTDACPCPCSIIIYWIPRHI